MTTEVEASIIRTTGGNLRLLKRLLAQIERVLDANDLSTIPAEAVLLARESLVVGQACVIGQGCRSPQSQSPAPSTGSARLFE